MKKILLAVALIWATGCHNITVASTADQRPQREHKERAIYTLNGLIPLSDVGEKCKESKLQKVESEYGAVDILISVGMGFASGLLAGGVCETQGCFLALTTLGPWIVSTRSVTYECADDGRVDW